jgi:hypothetical protein
VGIEDFPRHVNRQEAGVDQETSGQEEVRDKGITSAAAEVLLFQLPTKEFAALVLSDTCFAALREIRASCENLLVSSLSSFQ